MTALIERIRDVAFAGERCRGGAPGVTGLAAAVQQQYRTPAVAEHVSNQFVAGGADKSRGRGSEASAHDARRVKAIAYMIGRSPHKRSDVAGSAPDVARRWQRVHVARLDRAR